MTLASTAFVGANIVRPQALVSLRTFRGVEDADPYGVGADFLSARKSCGCCMVLRAGNARPYMRFTLSLSPA